MGAARTTSRGARAHWQGEEQNPNPNSEFRNPGMDRVVHGHVTELTVPVLFCSVGILYIVLTYLITIKLYE